MRNIEKRNLILLLIAAVWSSSCQPQTPPQAETPQETAGIPLQTETVRVWATIGSDSIATPSPTPTVRPIAVQLQGRIAFHSDRDGSLEIYVMNADGSTVSRLTNNPAVDVFPAWSPTEIRSLLPRIGMVIRISSS